MPRFVVFDGNGAAPLRAALRRRGWEDATESVPADEHGREHLTVENCALSKADVKRRNNERCARALAKGNAEFVWRDLLVAKHFDEDGVAAPSRSLHDDRYPATTADGALQIVNRFPQYASLTTKDGMLRSLAQYYAAEELEAACFLPLSFEVPNFNLSNSKEVSWDPTARAVTTTSVHTAHPGWAAFVAAHAAVAAGAEPRVAPSQGAFNLWLLKPVNGHGGEGIEVESEVAALERHLLRARLGSPAFIVQKYIEQPLLYDGRKFDVRLWAAVRAAPGSALGLEIFAYREGYVRTSSEPFVLGSGGGGEQAQCVHFTNYCMQRGSANLGRHEAGNTLSFAAVDRAAGAAVGFRERAVPAMHELVCDATLAARSELLGGLSRTANVDGRKKEKGGGARRVCAWFGYDFMLERSGRPLLIEINANPFLGTQNEWHAALVARAADDFVGLALEESAPDVATELLVGGAAPEVDGVEVAAWRGSGWVQLLGEAKGFPPPLYTTRQGARGPCSALRRRRRRRGAHRSAARRRRRRRRCARSSGTVAADAEG